MANPAIEKHLIIYEKEDDPERWLFPGARMQISVESLLALDRIYQAAIGSGGPPFLEAVCLEAERYLADATQGRPDPVRATCLLDVVDQALSLASMLIELIEGFRAMLSARIEEEGEAGSSPDALAKLADSAEALRTRGTQLLVLRARIQAFCTGGAET